MSNPIAEAAKAVSELNNPFGTEHMVAFTTYCSNDSFGRGWSYRGTVKFENGATRGEQNFTGDSFATLLVKMEAFIKELEASRG